MYVIIIGKDRYSVAIKSFKRKREYMFAYAHEKGVKGRNILQHGKLVPGKDQLQHVAK